MPEEPPMTPQRYARLQRLFLATCDLRPAEQPRILELLCPDDPALRDMAERLARLDSRIRSGGEP